MSSHRPTATRRSILLSLLLVLLLALSGCTTSVDDPEDETGGDATRSVSFRDHPELGPILVDGDGMTLYIFTNDEPGESRCSGDCAGAWPPYNVEERPDAPAEIDDRISLVERDDGAMQVAYDDRPLYYFVSDEAAGDANGDARNGVWFVVSPPPEDPEDLNGDGPFDTTTGEVTYHGDTTGFFATPDDRESATGIVMIHEWWGLNDNIRDMARLLATHGYAVLAVDLFNGSVAEDAQGAMAQIQGLDQEAANENMASAARFLRDRGAEEVASLGWCFGGGQSLQFALTGEELAATVIYYGNLVTDDERLAVIDQPVLGIFGEDDGSIPVASVRQFETALDNLSIDNQILIYPDVGHAFANPSGDNWGAAEAQDAWARTLRFLQEHAPIE